MEDLQNLRTQSRVESKRIDDLTAAKAALVIRIRDRDEELRGKAKLLEVGLPLILGSERSLRGD